MSRGRENVDEEQLAKFFVCTGNDGFLYVGHETCGEATQLPNQLDRPPALPAVVRQALEHRCTLNGKAKT